MDTFLTQMEILLKTDGVLLARVLVTGVGGVLLANFICRAAAHIREQGGRSQSASSHFVITLLRVGLYIVVACMVAVELNVPADSIFAELGIISVAVSLALKDTISSLANGVMIVTTKPFTQGDHVELAGVEGVVKTIRMFSTVLVTFDNKVITIPNQSVINGTITNYTRMPTRRVAVTAEVAYGCELEQVKRVLAGVVRETPHVLRTPAPFIRMTEMGASSLKFTVRVWTSLDNFYAVQADLNEGIYKALNAANIEIPFNQMDVHLRDLPPVRLSRPASAAGEEGHTDA